MQFVSYLNRKICFLSGKPVNKAFFVFGNRIRNAFLLVFSAVYAYNQDKGVIAKMKDKIQEFIFNLIIKFPEDRLPHPVHAWALNYGRRKIDQLQQDIIRQRWQKVDLDQTLSELRDKAQSED